MKEPLSAEQMREIATKTGMDKVVEREKSRRGQAPQTTGVPQGFRRAAWMLRDAIDGRKRD